MAYDSANDTLVLVDGVAGANDGASVVEVGVVAANGSTLDITSNTTTNNFTGFTLDGQSGTGFNAIQLASLNLSGITGSVPDISTANVTNNFTFVVLDQGSFPTPTETTTTTTTTSSRVQYWG